jgi:hypothetical protein
LSDLKLYDENPRSIQDKNQKALEACLKRFGYVDLIAYNIRTGRIIGGHQRYKILVENGVTRAKVIAADFTEEHEVAANLTLNNDKIEGQWDETTTDLIGEVELEDPEFFIDGNFDELHEAVGKIGRVSDDDGKDTECPCCGHRWNIEDGDVRVMSREEQEACR